MISSLRRPILENTQHSRDTNIDATGGIRTCNHRKRAEAAQALRKRRRAEYLIMYSSLFLAFPITYCNYHFTGNVYLLRIKACPMNTPHVRSFSTRKRTEFQICFVCSVIVKYNLWVTGIKYSDITDLYKNIKQLSNISKYMCQGR